jgi:hypothetical protein
VQAVLRAADGRAVASRGAVLPDAHDRYFEGIDSERGIAWRCADSCSLRDLLPLSNQIAAACLEHGCGREDLHKRYLIHVAGFNLGV